MLILIADDDSEDRDLLCAAISEIDSTIYCIPVADGQSILQLLNTQPVDLPDFIFLDINMPRMNGKECLTEIKKDYRFKEIPVIMYSTSANAKEKEECRNLGAYDFITKPSDFEKLINTLMVLLRY